MMQGGEPGPSGWAADGEALSFDDGGVLTGDDWLSPAFMRDDFLPLDDEPGSPSLADLVRRTRFPPYSSEPRENHMLDSLVRP